MNYSSEYFFPCLRDSTFLIQYFLVINLLFNSLFVLTSCQFLHNSRPQNEKWKSLNASRVFITLRFFFTFFYALAQKLDVVENFGIFVALKIHSMIIFLFINFLTPSRSEDFQYIKLTRNREGGRCSEWDAILLVKDYFIRSGDIRNT